MPIDTELIKDLGIAKYKGMEMAQQDIMKRRLMEESLQQAPLKTKAMEQDVQLGQIQVAEKQKVQEFQQDLAAQWKANPDMDVYTLIDQVARKHGLPAQAIEAYKMQNQLAEMALKTMLNIHEVYGPDKAKEFSQKDPILKGFGEPNIQKGPEGFHVVWDVQGMPEAAKGKMGFLVDNKGTVKPFNVPGAEAKTVNMPPWYDAMGVEKIGDRYHTTEGQKEFATWYSDPKNTKEVSEMRSKIIKETATPFYQVVPTEKGLETFASRQGEFVTPKPGEQPRKKMLSPDLIDFEGKMGVLEDSVNRVVENYDPKYVGVAMGRLGGLREMTTGIPKEQAQFYSSLARIKANMVYLLSGKQINETEYTRLLEQLPRRELPSGVFEARMEDFRKTMQTIVESRRQAAGGYAMPERGGAAKGKENLRTKYNY